MIIQHDVKPAIIQGRQYSDSDRDKPSGDGVFGALLADMSLSESIEDDDSADRLLPEIDQPIPLLINEPSINLLPPSFEVSPALANSDYAEEVPAMDLTQVISADVLTQVDDSQVDEDQVDDNHVDEPTRDKLSAAVEHTLVTNDENKTVLASQAPLSTILLAAHEAKLQNGISPNDAQRTDERATPAKNGKPQKTVSAAEFSQLISEAKAVTPNAAVVNELKPFKDQPAERDLPKPSLSIEQPAGASFKTTLNQATDSYVMTPSAIDESKGVKATAPYEIHYEAGQALQALGHRASLRIHQEGLGHINVKIEMNQQQSSVTLIADTNEARQMIQTHLPQLKVFFADANLNLTQANIEQRSQQEQSSQQQGQHQTNHFSTGVTTEPNEINQATNASKRVSQSLIDAYV